MQPQLTDTMPFLLKAFAVPGWLNIIHPFVFHYSLLPFLACFTYVDRLNLFYEIESLQFYFVLFCFASGYRRVTPPLLYLLWQSLWPGSLRVHSQSPSPLLFSATKTGGQILPFRVSLTHWDPAVASDPRGEFCSSGLLESFAFLCISIAMTEPVASFERLCSVAVMQVALCSLLG